MLQTADSATHNSFNLQQLNLFLQRDLGDRWRAFVSFEAVNTFSSFRDWGALSIEEAWIKYRLNEKFSLKLGLLVPTFNNFNEIKNRTPLLPYIVRPIAYETSFSEFIAVDEYTPERAYVQAYGFLSAGKTKLDYAAFIGNSPNINSSPNIRQTGIDTTATFLAGGRIGLRHEVLKAGFSLTRDNKNVLTGIFSDSLNLFQELTGSPSDSLKEIPRTRFGGDLSISLDRFMLEAEFISMRQSNKRGFDLERNFYYGTIGYRFSERLLAYAGYWIVDDVQITGPDRRSLRFDIPNAGFAYNYNERTTFKLQYAYGDIEAQITSRALVNTANFHIVAVAASVIF